MSDSSILPEPRAAYVHVPFCAQRCGYCNFTLVAGRDDLIDGYLTALARELSWLAHPRPVTTLFLGGGTPTHLPPQKLRRLLETITRWFPLEPGSEFSVEANPADLDAARADLLAEAGVTRLSLGAQSFDAAKLRRLERDHCADDIARSFALARERFASVSLDLIFGVPGETLDVWRADLDAALALAPDHLSTYGLTIERGTQFWNRRYHGTLTELDEETGRAMYVAAIDRLTAPRAAAAAGMHGSYEHYEVSNFARPGQRCRHNEVYWGGEEYFAAGPGAARYVAARREVNHRSTTSYMARVLAGRSPVAQAETLSPEDRARELLVLGLRRLEGVRRDDFWRRTGFDLEALVGAALRRHVERGLLEEGEGRVRLTREGLLVSDAIWPDFLRV